MPRVTIVIPTYNWSAVLPFSIGSVLRQTYADWELLVVGDGCTDDSAEVTARAAAGDARVRWINLPANTGQQSGPNNEGIRQAQGELIAYLGHDDLWMPRHLERLVAAIDAGADIAYAVVEMVLPERAAPRPAPWPLAPYAPGTWVPPSGIAHRRDAALAVGGWRHFRELADDPEVDLLRRLHAAGRTFAFVPRLGAVKLPAALRRDVYRTRPHQEQAAWFERIGADPDLEPTELARMLVAGLAQPPPPLLAMARDLVRVAWERLRRRLARRGDYKRLVFDERRAFKGLPPIP